MRCAGNQLQPLTATQLTYLTIDAGHNWLHSAFVPAQAGLGVYVLTYDTVDRALHATLHSQVLHPCSCLIRHRGSGAAHLTKRVPVLHRWFTD